MVPVQDPTGLPTKPKRRLLRLLLWCAGSAILLFSAFVATMWTQFGGTPGGERLVRIEASPQYDDGGFTNPILALSEGLSFELISERYAGSSAHRQPASPLPVVARTQADFAQPAPGLRITWLGHSTLLLEMEGIRVLVDPVWSEHAAPSPVFGIRRFYAPPLALEDLPPLDAVVISHDHYDHLDMETIRMLSDRVPRFVTPLGVGAHLEAWGVEPARIAELDWWEEVPVEGIRLVSTPARHFSGRSVSDRNATLWSGWAVLGDSTRLWYSGDTAMTPQFWEIGERLGPFDITLVESGAYNRLWTDVHLGPEQAVAAHRMVRGRLMVPVHWGLFDLALHGWTEPAERVKAAAQDAGVRVSFPRPGQSLTPDDYPVEPWWPALPWATASDSPIISTGLDPHVLSEVPGQPPIDLCSAGGALTLDHVVIGVRDLAAVSNAFAAAGLASTPGRLHANGLLNRHINLADGAEIELMTVSTPATDTQARHYEAMIQAGDGGVYLALRGVRDALESRGWPRALVTDAGPFRITTFGRVAPHLFGIEYGAGGNPGTPGEARLEEVWLEGNTDTENLFRTLGAVHCGVTQGPLGLEGRRYALSRGSVVVVPSTSTTPRIVGVALRQTGRRDPTPKLLSGVHLWFAEPES